MTSRARSCPALLPLSRDRAAQDDAERRRGQARGQAGGDVADSGAGVAAGGQLVDTDGDPAEGGQPAAEARAEERAYVSGRWEDLEDQDEQQREDERTGGVDEEDRPRERPRRGWQGQPDQVAGQAAEEATAGDRGDGKPVDAGPAAAAARGERSGRRCGPVASVLGGVEIRVEGQVPVVHVVGFPVLFGGWVTPTVWRSSARGSGSGHWCCRSAWPGLGPGELLFGLDADHRQMRLLRARLGGGDRFRHPPGTLGETVVRFAAEGAAGLGPPRSSVRRWRISGSGVTAASYSGSSRDRWPRKRRFTGGPHHPDATGRVPPGRADPSAPRSRERGRVRTGTAEVPVISDADHTGGTRPVSPVTPDGSDSSRGGTATMEGHKRVEPEAVKLTHYVAEPHLRDRRCRVDELLRRAAAAGASGATVLAAYQGFGRRHSHEPTLWHKADETPLTVIFVDTADPS